MNGCSHLRFLVWHKRIDRTQATDRPWGHSRLRICRECVRVCDHNALELPLSFYRLCGRVAVTDADAGIGNGSSGSSNVFRPRPHHRHCTGSNHHHQAPSGSVEQAALGKDLPLQLAGRQASRQAAGGRWQVAVAAADG